MTGNIKYTKIFCNYYKKQVQLQNITVFYLPYPLTYAYYLLSEKNHFYFKPDCSFYFVRNFHLSFTTN